MAHGGHGYRIRADVTDAGERLIVLLDARGLIEALGIATHAKAA
jgi:hypothetical protein